MSENQDKKVIKEQKKLQKQQIKDKKSFERWFKFLHVVEKFVRIFAPYKMHRARKNYGEGPFVIICNHYSVLDVIYPCMVNYKPVHFMAKQELWDNGFMRWFCNKSRCIPVSRDGAGTDVKAIMMAMRYLKAGETISIFPEGRRNKEGVDMLPFKGGFAAVAIKTRTPIVPIVQVRKAKKFRRSDILYGEPVEFTEYYGRKLTEEDIAECERRLRDIMLGMRADFLKKEEEKRAKKRK